MCGGRSWTDLIPKCYQVPKLERKVFLSPSHFTGASKYFVLSLSLSIFVRIQLLTLTAWYRYLFFWCCTGNILHPTGIDPESLGLNFKSAFRIRTFLIGSISGSGKNLNPDPVLYVHCTGYSVEKILKNLIILKILIKKWPVFMWRRQFGKQVVTGTFLLK